MLSHGTMCLQTPHRHRSVHLYVLPYLHGLKSGSMKPVLGHVSPRKQSTTTSKRSCCLCRTLQEWGKRFKSCCTLHLPGDISHSLQGTALCLQCSSAVCIKIARVQSGKSMLREGNSKQLAACYCLCHQPHGGRIDCCFTY